MLVAYDACMALGPKQANVMASCLEGPHKDPAMIIERDLPSGPRGVVQELLRS